MGYEVILNIQETSRRGWSARSGVSHPIISEVKSNPITPKLKN